MEGHTPGPWAYDATGKYYTDRVIRRNGRLIASIYEARGTQFDGMEPLPVETLANALLIAAAPDLLAACKAALDKLPAPCSDNDYRMGLAGEYSKAAYELWVAIAKAEGQS